MRAVVNTNHQDSSCQNLDQLISHLVNMELCYGIGSQIQFQINVVCGGNAQLRN